eukprot:4062037-Ditylum_brightwellii.AAC.1
MLLSCLHIPKPSSPTFTSSFKKIDNKGKEDKTYNHAIDTACCAAFAYVCGFLEEEDHAKMIDMEEVHVEEEAEKIDTMMIIALMVHLLVVAVGIWQWRQGMRS